MVPTLVLQSLTLCLLWPAGLAGSQQDGWEEVTPARAHFHLWLLLGLPAPTPTLSPHFLPLLSLSILPFPSPHPPLSPTRPLGLSLSFPVSVAFSLSLLLLPSELSNHPLSHPSPPAVPCSFSPLLAPSYCPSTWGALLAPNVVVPALRTPSQPSPLAF